jgi:8-oxo-dGTP pyrophosphatase MutT (NUDIX family)
MNERRRNGTRSGGGRATLETSAGGVVYRVHHGEPLFLLIRDSYRNWGLPKGHLETDESPDAAAEREVREETGLEALTLDGEIKTIEWYFRFRGKLVHKVCHFYLMKTTSVRTKPQRDEGITACRWASYDDAMRLVSYDNAREVLTRANEMVGMQRSGDGVAEDQSA